MDSRGPPPNRPLPPIPPRRGQRAEISASQEREDLPVTPTSGQQGAYLASLERSPPAQWGIDFSVPRNRTEAKSPGTPTRPPPRWENLRPAPRTPSRSRPLLGNFGSASPPPPVPPIPARFGVAPVPPTAPPPTPQIALRMHPRPHQKSPADPQEVAQQRANIPFRQGHIGQDIPAHPAISSSASTTIPGLTTPNTQLTRPETPPFGSVGTAASAEATNPGEVSR
ncbi:hypothetical protein B0H67DRAFT_132907 [Lasiosphaeris hirsuta]|uniref:Uncharacterized protein n=1 Tax=Lasiosphaeris hirsuta TaxID=260670 RepID=A0AA40B0L6_9PEZI|nr:hypothetical protein B0H67DRAFT_132907 [Lasiosphaeris hirsuta]